jgi:hypothetical protein
MEVQPMKNESRVLMDDAQHAALKVAAQKMGMKLAPYLRWCALRQAEELGIRIEQPKADH